MVTAVSFGIAQRSVFMARLSQELPFLFTVLGKSLGRRNFVDADQAQLHIIHATFLEIGTFHHREIRRLSLVYFRHADGPCNARIMPLL